MTPPYMTGAAPTSATPCGDPVRVASVQDTSLAAPAAAPSKIVDIQSQKIGELEVDEHDDAVRSAARDYLSRGWQPVPLYPAVLGDKNTGKRPIGNGWQESRLAADELQDALTEGRNVGIILGSPSGGLADVDLDCPEALDLADDLLPTTPMNHGRTSAPRSHRWYAVPDGQGRTVQFLDPFADPSAKQKATLVELRHTGGQTAVPPSLHFTGERLEWAGPLNPALAKWVVLLDAVERLAIGSALLRAGWTRQDALAFARATDRDWAKVPEPVREAAEDWGLAGAAHARNGAAKVARSTTSSTTRVDSARVLAGVPEGQRDIMLTRYAASLRSRGVRRVEAEALVAQAAAACFPPFLERDALAKVRSAWTNPKFDPVSDADALENARALTEALPQRLKSDPGAPFEPGVIDAMLLLQRHAPGDYARTRATLRVSKVSLRDLDRALNARKLPTELEVGTAVEYELRDGRLYWVHGENAERLANFDARIVDNASEDDGSGETRLVRTVEVTVGAAVRHLAPIPADQFRSLDFLDQVAEAVLEPGPRVRDRVRHAIQVRSGVVPTRIVYTHTGWTRLPDGRHVYLTSGGAIGGSGVVPGVEVRLPESLSRYDLPRPPEGADIVDAVRASLRALEVAPRRITVPLLGAVWRAPLPTLPDLSIFLEGVTGAQKTELAALAQQHWGAGLDARHLPGSWSSTANALEAQAFLARNALFVVDDFKPTGDRHVDRPLFDKAERLFRGAGNGAGRARLARSKTGGLSLSDAQPPRCMTVATGEDLPHGHSLTARLVVQRMTRGDVDLGKLTAAQADAAAGIYAKTMAAFVRWLAPQVPTLTADHNRRIAEIRDDLRSSGDRANTNVAHMIYAWETFARFAKDVNALTVDDASALLLDIRSVMTASLSEQDAAQRETDPVDRFPGLLTSALLSGQVHVANPKGGQPPSPTVWGWRGGSPQGARIGWVDGANLYLDRDGAYSAAQRIAEESGEPLPIKPSTLVARLAERKLLLSCEPSRQTKLVRATLEGVRREVLHISASLVAQQAPQAGKFQFVAAEPIEPDSGVHPSSNIDDPPILD